MITRFQRLAVLAILILSASGICWGKKSKSFTANHTSQDAARNRVEERLQTSGAVRLRLRDHTRVEGRVLKTSSDHFTFQTLEDSKIVERTIRFDQVKKVSYIYPRHPILQWIGGNVAGSAILALIILAAVGAL